MTALAPFAVVPEVLGALKNAARATADVLYLGTFGNAEQNPPNDLDVLVVTARGRAEAVRELVARVIAQCEGAALVWSNDPAYVYGERPLVPLHVDIDLHEEGTGFFRRHPLVGWSIAESCHAFFQRADLRDVVDVPAQPVEASRRLAIALDDRSGITDFIRRFTEDDRYDGRRILALTVRNIAWALTGRMHGSAADGIRTLDRELPELRDLTEPLRRFIAGCETVPEPRTFTITALTRLRDSCRRRSLDASAPVFSGEHGFEAFARMLLLSQPEIEIRRHALRRSYMPFRVTRHYASLIAAASEPERTQLLNVVLPHGGPVAFRGRFDPYGNTSYGQERAFLQHKYERTLLLHLEDACIANCQFCYKVNELRVERRDPTPLPGRIDAAIDYLRVHPEIDNVLVSGGDPLVARNTLPLAIARLLAETGVRIVRVASKALAYDPELLAAPALLEVCRGAPAGKQVTVIAHISHARELTAEALRVIRILRSAGVDIRSQPTILAGVNDDARTLADLQRALIDAHVIPYYFTVFMPVRGVEQYALRLHEAWIAFAESKRLLGGIDKKSVLVASHDWGKLEILGFLPSSRNPEKIVLRWHQVAADHLPGTLGARFEFTAEELMILDYEATSIYCVDHLFAYNGLSYFDENGALRQ